MELVRGNLVAAIPDMSAVGDAFAGGLLGAFVTGKPLEDCVEVGHQLGRMCVQQVGMEGL